MIANVLRYKGQTINPKELYKQLLSMQSPETSFPVQRALGSIGGAVSKGFIKKNIYGDYVRCR